MDNTEKELPENQEIDTLKKEVASNEVSSEEDKWIFRDLPEYVQTLLKQKPLFKDVFLSWNKRYVTKGFVDYLPDFGTKENDGEYWHGKMFWRYVGWNNGHKYTGEKLRQLRSEFGVGRRNKLGASHVEEQAAQSALSG